MDSNQPPINPSITPSMDTPSSPDAPIIPPVQPIIPPQTPFDPSQQNSKKSNGKTSVIIGAIFLLMILPVVGYYVAQKTNIMNNLPFAEREDKNQIIGRSGITVSGASGPVSVKVPGEPINPKECFGPKTCPAGQSRICEETWRNNQTPNATSHCDCRCEGAANTPTSTPTNTPTISLTPQPPSSTPVITNTPIPTNPPSSPGGCDASCGSDSECQSGYICASVQGINRCRRSACTQESSCNCPATATPTPTTAGTTQVAVVVTATPTPKIPVAGAPAVLGVATVGGGLFLLLLGFLL